MDYHTQLHRLVNRKMSELAREGAEISKPAGIEPAKFVAMAVGLIGHYWGDMIEDCGFLGRDKAQVRHALEQAFKIGIAPTIGDALRLLQEAHGTPPTGKPPSVN